MSATYYILSLKHSPAPGGMSVWWGPNNCGYYCDLNSAGIYSQEEIDSNPGYLNNGVDTRAVERISVVQAARSMVFYSDAKKL
jgi:hypothetical protein